MQKAELSSFVNQYSPKQLLGKDYATQSGEHWTPQDLKQLIFMESQNNIVNGVLKNEIDVGFIRTDQLERTINVTMGELVDPALVKIINPQTNLTIEALDDPLA